MARVSVPRGKRAEGAAPLVAQARGAEGVGDDRRRVLKQQRRLQGQHQIARERARLTFVVTLGTLHTLL